MKKHIFILFIIAVITIPRAGAQPLAWIWAKDGGGSGSKTALDVACNKNNGDVYMVGSFNGNLSSVYGAALSGATGPLDAFVAKYNSSGNVLWAFKLGGNGEEEAEAAAVDPFGNLYVSGYFKSTTDFDPSASVFTLSPSGAKDGFLAKYDAAGNFIWAAKFGGSGDDEPNRIYCDSSAVYVTGYYNSPATFYSTNSVTKAPLANQGVSNMFGAKYNSAGVVQWVISAGSSKEDEGYDVIADNNNVYFIGDYSSGLSFYNLSAVTSLSLQSYNPGKPDVFILACTQSGTLLWVSNVASNQADHGGGITADSSGLYITGSIGDDASFRYPLPQYTQINQGSDDIFIAKLSKTTGLFQWIAPVTGSGGNSESGFEIEKTSSNDIVITGPYNSTLTYTAAGGPVFPASGQDAIVAVYSTSGAFKWALKAGGANTDTPYGLCTDLLGSIYICGIQDGATFGNISLPGSNNNMFAARIGCSVVGNNIISASQTICTSAAPVPLSGSLPSLGIPPYTYLWEQSSNSIAWVPASGTNTAKNYTPSPLSSPMYFRRTVYSPGTTSCPSSFSISDTILIKVDAMPSIANAGSDMSICSGSVVLSGNIPAVGTGSWSLVSGTGTIVSASSNTTTANGLQTGTTVFKWTISNGICPASYDKVSITRDAMPASVSAGNDVTLCTSSVTLTGNNPSAGTGTWSVVSGSATVAQTSNTALVSGLQPGLTVLRWSISNGSCPAIYDEVTVTHDQFPTTPDAGRDISVCSSSMTLTGNMPSVGTGTWSLVNGTATVGAATLNTAAVQGLALGTSTFRWSISNGTCPVVHDDITVTRDAMPDQAVAGTDIKTNAPFAMLNANTPVIGSGSWSIAQGEGLFSNMSDPHASVSALQNGTNILRWTISNGSCPPSSDDLAIEFSGLEIPNAFSPNGDRINDDFQIPGLEYYPGVNFTVFDRWGSEVYSSSNYRNDWNGRNNNNQDLSDDTYYYILNISEHMNFKGYIILKRNK